MGFFSGLVIGIVISAVAFVCIAMRMTAKYDAEKAERWQHLRAQNDPDNSFNWTPSRER